MSRRWLLSVVMGLAIAVTLAAGSPSGVAESDDRGVLVTDTSPRPAPCPRVDATGGRFVRGGCRARAESDHTLFSIRTALGRIRFADCPTRFDVTLAADGRMWLDNLWILSRFGEPVCADIWPCAPPEVIARRTKASYAPPRALVPPWRGELLRPGRGGYVGRFRLCVDSCVGRYAGDVEVTLTRSGPGWAMRAQAAAVGDTQLELDAEWAMSGSAGFDVEPRGRSTGTDRPASEAARGRSR